MKNETKVILKNKEFTINKMLSSDGWPISVKLGKYISKPLSDAMEGLDIKDAESMATVLVKYLSNLSVENIMELTKDLFDSKYIKYKNESGNEEAFNINVFDGEYGSILRLLIEIIKFNFSSFFFELLEILSEVTGMKFNTKKLA
jgi:hypothetical protein